MRTSSSQVDQSLTVRTKKERQKGRKRKRKKNGGIRSPEEQRRKMLPSISEFGIRVYGFAVCGCGRDRPKASKQPYMCMHVHMSSANRASVVRRPSA